MADIAAEMKVYECRFGLILREDSRVFVIAPSFSAAMELFAREKGGYLQMIRELPDGTVFWEKM